MADQKRTKTGKCRTSKMTDPDTAKFCACLRKNANFFRVMSSSIGLESNVTDTALNSLFVSRAYALCGLTARFLSTSIHL